ncbi:MAG: hypothetical protein J6334_03905 [Kiritimatiellae bacterium]|nr:hypothetical protein [Kiritimatiellia bacterium]
MKKMLAVCAACMVAGLASADVTSDNIVGFMKASTTAESASVGAMFVTVGADVWRLGDLKAEGMEPGVDSIQFLDTNTASTYIQATYISAEIAAEEGDPDLEGWWDMNDVGGTRLDDTVFEKGTAFLCAFAGSEVTFTFAGEVLAGEVEIDVSGMPSPFICNPIPVDLTLGQIKAIDFEPGLDSIQFLDVDSATTYIQATYISAEFAAEEGDADLEGWWDLNDIGGTSLNDTPVPAGQAFLGAIESGNAVKFVFPAAY